MTVHCSIVTDSELMSNNTTVNNTEVFGKHLTKTSVSKGPASEYY